MRAFIVIFLFLCLHLHATSEPFNYDPFVEAQALIQKSTPAQKKQVEKKRNIISLGAIMSNRAFINGKWYAKGDRFGSYRVDMIRPNMVGLKKNGKLKIISLGSKKNVLTVKEKE